MERYYRIPVGERRLVTFTYNNRKIELDFDKTIDNMKNDIPLRVEGIEINYNDLSVVSVLYIKEFISEPFDEIKEFKLALNRC
jgi:hypothetical protein